MPAPSLEFDTLDHRLAPTFCGEDHFAGPDGLAIRCQNQQAAIEYHQPGNLADSRLILPAKALEDFGGREETPILLEAVTAKQVAARWTENGVPQYRLYDEASVKPPQSFPALPKQFTENPPGMLKQLDDACQTCADESIRFALRNLQLRNKQGQIVATDGRHAFQKSGFCFPWQGDVLVPRTRVFGRQRIGRKQPCTHCPRRELGSVSGWTLDDLAGDRPRSAVSPN